MKSKLVPINTIVCLFTTIICMVIVFNGCATLNTPEKKYYAALRAFNDNVAEYQNHYKMASQAQQEEWKANIDPAIKIASIALDNWKQFLGTSSADEKEQAWIQAKNALILLLFRYEILQVGG